MISAGLRWTEMKRGGSSESVGQAVVSRNRVALVIANSEYASLTQLSNAKNDGEGMSSELTSRGFAVTALVNATAIQMERAMLTAMGFPAEMIQQYTSTLTRAPSALELEDSGRHVTISLRLLR